MAQSWTIYVCHTDYIGDGPLAWQDLAVGRWEDKIRSWGLRSISSWTYFVRKKIDLFLGTKNLYFIYALDHHHHSFLSISPFSSFYCVWVKSTWMVRYMCNLTLLPTEHAKTTYFQISFSIFLNIPIFQPHALLVRVVIRWKFANRRGRGNQKTERIQRRAHKSVLDFSFWPVWGPSDRWEKVWPTWPRCTNNGDEPLPTNRRVKMVGSLSSRREDLTRPFPLQKPCIKQRLCCFRHQLR